VPEIVTARLMVRELRLEDAEPLARMWADAEVTRFMGGPRDYETLRLAFEEDVRAGIPPQFDLWPVIEKAAGKVVGHCGLLDKEVEGRAEVELVYVFDPPAWGKGYATEVATALRDYARSALHLRRIISLIEPENAASERVACKIGMQLEKETLRPGGRVMHLYALSLGD
jgi:[ribosomal protein S5]-alanine N-acetyltransferase